MNVDEFPDRKIRIEGVEYFYFGGTNYLGMSTNTDFQNLLFESIKKWGTAYGSSRNSNIKLSIYSAAEELLARNCKTEAALTVSSGMLAGKLIIEHLSKTSDALFHFPNTHPAIWTPSSLPIMENGKLNSKIFDPTISKISILADAIPSLEVKPIDFSILLEIPKEKEVTLVIDESHSLGISGKKGSGILSTLNNLKVYRKVGIASLGKAYGLSGGMIAGDRTFIAEIRNQASFIGASGMNPAFLETYIKAQELYQAQLLKLDQNLDYINAHFSNREGFIFNKDYPVIYFESDGISKKLLKNNIITTSFKYPTSSGMLNRIVITANHIKDDLDKLLTQLNAIN
jgi:8-amino-7-oxononanoate synthase